MPIHHQLPGSLMTETKKKKQKKKRTNRKDVRYASILSSHVSAGSNRRSIESIRKRLFRARLYKELPGTKKLNPVDCHADKTTNIPQIKLELKATLTVSNKKKNNPLSTPVRQKKNYRCFLQQVFFPISNAKNTRVVAKKLAKKKSVKHRTPTKKKNAINEFQ